jgi:hypothetical protein
MTREELDWKQYELIALTVRAGIETAIKTNVLYYAVTGAMLSFYLSRSNPAPNLRFALLLPVLMGLMGGGLFLTSARTMWRGDDEAEVLARRLGFTTWPSTMPLRAALIGSAILMFLVAVGLSVLIMCPRVVGS